MFRAFTASALCAATWSAVPNGATAQSLSDAPRAANRWVDVPAGDYRLGEKGHTVNPEHTARLHAFRIASREATNAEFAAFIKATGYRTDTERRGYGMVFREGMIDWEWERKKGASWRDPDGNGQTAIPDHPVTQVSWTDAIAYCKWAKARLPTLDEWEVAARAGSRKRFPWGATYAPGHANVWEGETHRRNSREDGYVTTAPVAAFKPNAWGLSDVIGNVFEYCADVPATIASSTPVASARGGSWWCSAGTCSFFNLLDIGEMTPHASFSNQGFRVVDDL